MLCVLVHPRFHPSTRLPARVTECDTNRNEQIGINVESSVPVGATR